jgi:hypothetical protein
LHTTVGDGGAEVIHMATEARGDLISLLQRLVELTVRLVGGRIELATAQVRAGAARAGRRAAWGLAGAVTITVGAALLGLAAAEALAPRVGGRAIALLIVAAPFLVVGGVLASRASDRGVAGAAANEPDGDRDQRQDQQHVDPRAHRVAAHHAEQPEHQQ